jgi:subtilisin family serine protease
LSKPNLLIGNGEVLAKLLDSDKAGSSTTVYPYSILRARERLSAGILGIVGALDGLPAGAKPHNEGTGLVTVHPAFLSKWKMPRAIFAHAGLRATGSRLVRVKPETEVRVRAPIGEQAAAQVYVTGTADAFRRFHQLLMSDDTSQADQNEFRALEVVTSVSPADRLLNLDADAQRVAVEAVLHGDSSDAILLTALESYAEKCGVTLLLKKHIGVPGLVFVPGHASSRALQRFADFTALRAIRPLAKLRLNRPVVRQRLTQIAPALPRDDAINPAIVVDVFDGGIGTRDFGQWCTEFVSPPLEATHADYLSHGTEVTSALLFGEVASDAVELPTPYFRVRHHRVIGVDDERDVDLFDCIHRIEAALKNEHVEFANLSLGPRMTIDDDHPHVWTTVLDSHLAAGQTLLTVAVGNDGGEANGMGRIQPPADAVNALAVGAADSPDFMWSRARYSCHGPGRSPGRVKPDGVSFGGTEERPLILLNPLSGGLTGVQGTSFAAPMVLRTAAAARAVSATPLSATTLRALLIHRASRHEDHDARDVGWGRFPTNEHELLTCADSEVSVIYQGVVAAGRTLRVGVPVPPVPLGVALTITATFCFASPVDPADTINYTRNGLTVVFRPQGDGTSFPFFSSGGYDTEQELRAGASKWETVLHKTARFRAEQLLDACFDVTHGARERGLSVKNKLVPPLPYVLIVTIATQHGERIYESVMNKYQTLAPIQLREQIQLRAGRN